MACGGSASPGIRGNGNAGPVADAGTIDAGSLVDAGAQGDAGAMMSSVVSIDLSQTDIRIPAGANTAFAVTGTQMDGSRVDVTPQSQAVSSNPSVATVSNGPGSQIQVRAISPGSATITVTYGPLQQTAAVAVNR